MSKNIWYSNKRLKEHSCRSQTLLVQCTIKCAKKTFHIWYHFPMAYSSPHEYFVNDLKKDFRPSWYRTKHEEIK